MPDTNEFDIWARVVEIAEGSTALVSLCGGESNPLRAWYDIGVANRPIVAGRVDQGRLRGGSDDPWNWMLTLDVFVEFDSTGRAAAIADVLEGLITFTNLNSTGGMTTTPVDVAPQLRRRLPQPELDEGRNRLTLEWDLRHNR